MLNSRTDIFMLFEPALGGELFTLLHAKGTFSEKMTRMSAAEKPPNPSTSLPRSLRTRARARAHGLLLCRAGVWAVNTAASPAGIPRW